MVTFCNNTIDLTCAGTGVVSVVAQMMPSCQAACPFTFNGTAVTCSLPPAVAVACNAAVSTPADSLVVGADSPFRAHDALYAEGT